MVRLEALGIPPRRRRSESHHSLLHVATHRRIHSGEHQDAPWTAHLRELGGDLRADPGTRGSAARFLVDPPVDVSQKSFSENLMRAFVRCDSFAVASTSGLDPALRIRRLPARRRPTVSMCVLDLRNEAQVIG